MTKFNNVSTKDLIEIGKLSKEIKKNMADGNEKIAYDILGDLNNKLSDLNGNVLEMDEVLKIEQQSKDSALITLGLYFLRTIYNSCNERSGITC